MESRSNANVDSVLSVWPWCVVASCARRVVNAAWIAAICAAKLYDQWHRRYLSSCWRWNFSIRPQRSGTNYCTLSIAIIYFRLLHCAFAFSGQNTPGSVNLTPISVHSIQGLFHWLLSSTWLEVQEQEVHCRGTCAYMYWIHEKIALSKHSIIMLSRNNVTPHVGELWVKSLYWYQTRKPQLLDILSDIKLDKPLHMQSFHSGLLLFRDAKHSS